MVYCGEGGPSRAICALDTATGRRVWRAPLGSESGEYVIGPTVAGGRSLWPRAPTCAAAQTRKRGPRSSAAPLRRSTPKPARSSGPARISTPGPHDVDGTVLACPMWSSADEKLYLLDCRTGETIWAKTPVALHYSPPVTLTKDLVLYQPWGPKLHALLRATGEPLWTFHNEFTSAGCCTPVVSGRYAYLGTSVPERSGDLESLRGFRLADTPSNLGKYGTMHAIDLATGKSVWHFPTTNTVCGEPAIRVWTPLLRGPRRAGLLLCPRREGRTMTPEARTRRRPPQRPTSLGFSLRASNAHVILCAAKNLRTSRRDPSLRSG